MSADASVAAATGGDTTFTAAANDAATRWRAVTGADPCADGRFVYAVRTTGVYCRPTCPARRPRRANVRFFDTAAAAERAGFRPCKRCRPAETAAAAGDIVETRGAVLFVDLFAASAAMLRASPSEAASGALRFLAALEATVSAHGGVVQTVLRDGALIWFEQPATIGAANEARAALACALALGERDVRDGPGRLRQGLHYGRVGAAVVRGHGGQRAELVGQILNVAKRLEQAPRRSDARLLVSDAAVRVSGIDPADLGLRHLAGPLRLRGCRRLAAWAR